ncbi:MAG: hypothetical protein ABFD50_03830 [Smithella sp.]
MKKISIILLLLLSVSACTMFKNRTAEISRQARDEAIQNMKFSGSGDMNTADIDCRKYVDEENVSIVATGNQYGAQAKHNYLYCMESKGFKCIENCTVQWF